MIVVIVATVGTVVVISCCVSHVCHVDLLSMCVCLMELSNTFTHTHTHTHKHTHTHTHTHTHNNTKVVCLDKNVFILVPAIVILPEFHRKYQVLCGFQKSKVEVYCGEVNIISVT